MPDPDTPRAAKRMRVDWDAPRVDEAKGAPATLNDPDPTEEPREQIPMQLPARQPTLHQNRESTDQMCKQAPGSGE